MEKRFDRLEQRVDEVKDDVVELKHEFRVHTELMKEHIAGDKKIIQKITPLLDALPAINSIVQDHHLDRLEKSRSSKKRKVLMDRIKIVSGILGIIGMTSAYFLS